LKAWRFGREDVAVRVELEAPFLSVVHLVECERMERKRGRERKRRKGGRSSLAGQTVVSLPRESKGGGRC